MHFGLGDFVGVYSGRTSLRESGRIEEDLGDGEKSSSVPSDCIKYRDSDGFIQL